MAGVTGLGSIRRSRFGRDSRRQKACSSETRDAFRLRVCRCAFARQSHVSKPEDHSLAVTLVVLLVRSVVRPVESHRRSCVCASFRRQAEVFREVVRMSWSCSQALVCSERRCCWMFSLAVNPSGCFSGLDRSANVDILPSIERIDCSLRKRLRRFTNIASVTRLMRFDRCIE